MKVDIEAFNAIVAKESTRRDELEPHTLDWYTYTNRLALLEEVGKLFTEEVARVPHKSHIPKKQETVEKEPDNE